jgi:tetratricopeptide (TPR) repeat protein
VAGELARRAAAQPDRIQAEADRWYVAGIRMSCGLDAPGAATSGENAGSLHEAVDLVAAAVRQRPSHALYRLSLGYLQMRRKAWHAAVVEFDQAVQAAPDFLTNSTTLLARCLSCLLAEVGVLRRTGDRKGALHVLDDAAGRAQRAPEWLARIALRRGDVLADGDQRLPAEISYGRAEQLAQEVGDLATRAISQARRGAMRAVAGDPGSALELWHAALAAFTDDRRESPYWDLVSACSSLPSAVIRDSAFRRLLGELRDDPVT